MVVPRLHTELQGGCKCYVSSPVAKLWFWIENHDWHNCFWMSSWGSPLLDPKKLQNQQFYIIDWIRKKLLVDVANLATCCHDDCDVLLEVWEPCANAMLVVLLPKLWFWIPNISKQKTQHTHKKRRFTWMILKYLECVWHFVEPYGAAWTASCSGWNNPSCGLYKMGTRVK